MNNYQYWNVVKGLGIIAVVIGHTGSFITKYVYMYHLALFFFVAGYFYKDKYSIDPFTYFAKRMRSLWWPMVKYGVAFALLHNVFLQLSIYSSKTFEGIITTKYFNISDFFWSIKGAIFMQGLEQIGGAMWFVQPLLIGLMIFCTIRRFAFGLMGWKREIVVCILVLLIYNMGLTIIRRGISIEYYSDIAMLILPVIYTGFLTNKYWMQIPIKWYLGLASLLVIVTIYKITGTHVELSIKQIIGPKWFLLASFSGIYFNLVLARIILMSKKFGLLIAYIGERSFHIMALHFLMFKIVNLFYVVINNKPLFWIAKIPVINPKWWIAYTVVGILGSVTFVEVFKYLKSISVANLKVFELIKTYHK